ncbi:hypothetical protein VPH35_126386 [Triticum aestivum]
MEAPAADAAVRRGLVIATSRRSAERRLTRCAVVAVVVGSARQFEIIDVKRAVAMKFRIDEEAIKVSLRALGEMLLLFDDAAVRDRVLAGRGPLVLGRISLLVAPWSRFQRVSPAKLLYKVRVCLEGVPEHAWDIESVALLFDPSMLIDSIDHEVRREQETGCFRLWVWMDATRGVLQLEEPMEEGSPGMHFPELNITQEVPRCWGQVAMLGHPVLIHLDHVIDFTCPPSPDSGMSCDSGISGMPSEDGMVPDWPARWGYRWFLNYEDGDFPPPPPRDSVHSRLRFPDAGGNGGGGGRRTYGSGSGFRQASVGMQQAEQGGRSHQGRAGSGGGAGGGGRRRCGWPEEGLAVPPLIDMVEANGAPAAVDPFACAHGVLGLSVLLQQGTLAAPGVPTAQDGMGEGGQRAVEEELLAPFRESLRELSEDQPEQFSVPLMGGNEGGKPEEEGGRRQATRRATCMVVPMQEQRVVQRHPPRWGQMERRR